jgi:hypothetical protein
MLASTVPKQHGFATTNHNDICVAIYKAAFPFLWRLLMPLRNPSTIAAIRNKGTLEDYHEGAALSMTPRLMQQY